MNNVCIYWSLTNVCVLFYEIRLERNKPHDKIWFDVQGMDVCSVDCFGRIHSYDLYKSVSSVGSDATINLDSTARVEIDRDFKFHSSCISINSIDSTVLVGSDEYAQIARWDPRSPNKAVFATMACMDKEGTGQIYDPVYSIEWNPNNSNEFMTTHSKTVRVWDAFATFHNLGEHTLRKAQWSPHRSDCIAGLTIGGQICIWKIKKFDGPVDQTTPQQIPEMLFRHQGHDLMVSDFAWCPYLEDVISTVAPGSKERAGNIQVWRPRNLHDLDDNGEP
ncbi:retinoblastoma binding protein [Lobosporangium transversale]|nr:retinoblastoma binding protein [Lobosporangium transversale]